jgi:regulator of replication initiation timing
MTNYDTLKEYEAHQTPVPSYEELQNMNEAVNECMAANIKLVKENKQLKELLKKVKDYLPEFETPMNILAKIDEVLK